VTITKEHRVVKLSEIIPYANNPRKNDQAVPVVEASIERFTYTTEIEVDESMVILAGHTRWKALKKMGVEECEVMIIRGMTNEEKIAYRLAHNKTGEVAEWDTELLMEELDAIEEIPMEELGFKTTEVGPVEVVEDDYEPEPPEEPKSKRGEVYQLGNHRLMCGDSTSPDDMAKLMDGCKADISFTSPPYNAHHLDVRSSEERGGGIQKGTQKKYLADNDNKSDEDYMKFLETNINILMDNSEEVFYNIGIGAGSKRTICRILETFSGNFKDLLYWKKTNPMPVIAKGVISSAVELIIAFGRNGTRAFNHFDDRLFHGVVEGMSAFATNEYADIHKATFPMYLPAEIIQKFTEGGGTVLDCFGGTGTTMLACEQLGRTCYMMELEPVYVDVIIDRWEKFTGKKAVKVSG